MPLAKHQEAFAMIIEMIAEGVIEDPISPWLEPYLVKKIIILFIESS